METDVGQDFQDFWAEYKILQDKGHDEDDYGNGSDELQHGHALPQRHAGLAGLGAAARGCRPGVVLAAQLAAGPIAAHAALCALRALCAALGRGHRPRIAPHATTQLRAALPPRQHARGARRPQGGPQAAQRPRRRRPAGA